MPKRKSSDRPTDESAASKLIEIRQDSAIDLKGCGFALLYDPVVLTDRVLATLRGHYRQAEDDWQNATPRLNPFTGGVTPARPGPPPRPLCTAAEQLAFLRDLVSSYAGRQALTCLDVCGDEDLSVGLRLTTGPFTLDERRPREIERHWLTVTDGRVCVASSEILRASPQDLEPGGQCRPVFLGPCRAELTVPPGDYEVVVSEFAARLPYDFVVQLLAGTVV